MSVLTLKVVAGPLAGRSVVRARGRVSIGRSSAADLRIDEPGVHWEHAAVDVGETLITFENFAAGGTLVNGKVAQRTARLKHGDTIAISDKTTLQVSLPPTKSSRPRWAVAGMAACALAALLFVSLRSRPGPPRRQENWDRAFLVLHRWLPASNLPNGVGAVLAEDLANAWRLEKQGDSHAKEAYQRLAGQSAAIMGRAPSSESALRSLQKVAATGDKVAPDRERLIGALHGFALERVRIAAPR